MAPIDNNEEIIIEEEIEEEMLEEVEEEKVKTTSFQVRDGYLPSVKIMF